MIVIIISLVAILTECLFIYGLLKKIKNPQDKKLIFFVGIVISYFLSALITGFSYKLHIWFYLLYVVQIFLIMRFLYKEKTFILDITVCLFLFYIIIFVCALSLSLSYFNIVNYNIAFIISRILLLITYLILTKYITRLYSKYIKFWHRRDDGKIKAITIRNLSLITINIGLYFINILLAVLIISQQ